MRSRENPSHVGLSWNGGKIQAVGLLKYSPRTDHATRAVRCLMGFLHDMSLRQGKLLDEFRQLRKTVRDWEMVTHKIL
jgi:hypothetical protein